MDEPNPTDKGQPVLQARIVQQRPSSSVGPFIALAVLGLVVLGCCLLVPLAGSGMHTGGPIADQLKERLVQKGDAQHRILVVRVHGVISDQGGGLFGGARVGLVDTVRGILDRAEKDETIKALVLRVDSPGGGVTESDEIYDALVRFKKKTQRPLIVSMGGTCASGGYYISAPADKIFAQETTITGSIGVILSGYNYHKLLEKIGVEGITVASGPNKAILSGSEPPNPEHREILQSTIDDMYARFVKIVSEGRKISLEDIKSRKLADGRIFTAHQAKELGLVDELGYLHDAIADTRKTINALDAAVIEYGREPNIMDLFQARAEVPALLNTEQLLGSGPRYLYLWKP